MTDDNFEHIRVPMIYGFDKNDNETVVVNFDMYVKDFNELLSAERRFKAQLDHRYNIPENKSRIGIRTLSGEPVHEAGIT